MFVVPQPNGTYFVIGPVPSSTSSWVPVSGTGVILSHIPIDLSRVQQASMAASLIDEAPSPATDLPVGTECLPMAQVARLQEVSVPPEAAVPESTAATSTSRPAARERFAITAAQMREARRMPNEFKIVCARRLRLHRPDLSSDQIQAISGATTLPLARDAAYNGSMDALRDILTELPREDDEGALAYATRVHMRHPKLPLVNLDMLSGAGLPTLRAHLSSGDPNTTLDQVLTAVPRNPEETLRQHARHLRSQFPHLLKSQLARITGSSACNIGGDPKLAVLSDKERQIRDEIPRDPGESGTRHALRILAAQPSLSPRQVANITGLDENNIRQKLRMQRARASTNSTTATAAAAMAAFLVHKASTGEAPQRRTLETSIRYALRLHLHNRDLSTEQLAAASGATLEQIGACTAFRRSEAELVAVGVKWPRDADESRLRYGLRLLSSDPSLLEEEAAVLADVNAGSLRRTVRNADSAVDHSGQSSTSEARLTAPPAAPSSNATPT
ncbi:hypothetical protein PAQ31011_04685 [Pandoraea aquatica]|uniref:Uncharacterized protein n=1 Tax=Pandoraea aquatica TaxID=2508290 RepID=A0A5E4YQT2_9BURK|nr:hypothetical protein [Pandoraea aquatica]VVE50610.1 hypothetical protein PAQ31011_04685 [Pandoraea aquatica]